MYVIHMIAVRDHHVRVAIAMHVIGVQGRFQRRFTSRIGIGDLENMFVDVAVMHKVKMPIMEIIPMINMPDFCMSAIVAVDVCVIAMNVGSMCFGRNGTGAEDGDCGSNKDELAH